jgi:hypothetical protein
MFLIVKPTEYGVQVSLNPQKLPEIRRLLDE